MDPQAMKRATPPLQMILNRVHVGSSLNMIILKSLPSSEIAFDVVLRRDQGSINVTKVIAHKSGVT